MKGLVKFCKAFLIAILIGAIVLGGCFIGGYLFLFNTGDDFEISAFSLNYSTIIYCPDDEGGYMEVDRLYGSQNRVWADISNIPKYMQDAFVAIEDERFYKHNGVDIPRTLKATFIHLTKGTSSFGGSTITQQLVKNITNDRDTTKARKIREMWRAMSLERKLEKDQILELYLNTIYLANSCNGVQSAANKYFDKDISELTLAECASIAGITQYPSYYDPLVNPENNIEKQRIILSKMLELEFISQEEYDAALEEELVFQNKSARENSSFQSFFVDEVINEVLEDLMDKGYSETYAKNLLYTGGLKIYSTLDPHVQKSIEEIFIDEANFPNVSGDVKPQSAMIILDKNGAVKGVVGRIGEKTGDRILNLATQTKRQPGSSIKPIGVYAPAIEKNIISPATQVLDAPINIGGWRPVNYYSGYKGTISAREAMNQSMNTPAVRVLQDVGVDYSFEFLNKKLGIKSLVELEERDSGTFTDKNLSSLALGGLTYGLTGKELAGAYVPFINGGNFYEPHCYTKVVDSSGKVLLSNEEEPTRAMSEQTAYLTNSMLQSVVRSGTGTMARLSSGMPVGGKTGTTDDEKDRWFVGITPYYVGVVWYGYEIPQRMNFLSSSPCTPVWKKVMEKVHNGLDVIKFEMPKGITQAKICSKSGKIPIEGCTEGYDYFKSGNTPKSKCDGKHEDPNATPSPEPSQTPTAEESPSAQATDEPVAETPAAEATGEPQPETTPEPVSEATPESDNVISIE